MKQVFLALVRVSVRFQVFVDAKFAHSPNAFFEKRKTNAIKKNMDWSTSIVFKNQTNPSKRKAT